MDEAAPGVLDKHGDVTEEDDKREEEQHGYHRDHDDNGQVG